MGPGCAGPEIQPEQGPEPSQIEGFDGGQELGVNAQDERHGAAAHPWHHIRRAHAGALGNQQAPPAPVAPIVCY